jgi:hypothetical protein
MIKTKQQMYELLAAGRLGNTVPQYFDLPTFFANAGSIRYWGIRSLTPGGPCHLNVNAYLVPSIIRQEYIPGTYNISMMVDQIYTVTAWLEIWDSPTGLVVYGIEYPPRGTSWRKDMPSMGKQYEGIAAHMLLRKHLNPNSYSDVMDMLDTYPNHIVELSALENCLGTVPHRNHITCEVRDY